jgi:hypothetical protein
MFFLPGGGEAALDEVVVTAADRVPAEGVDFIVGRTEWRFRQMLTNFNAGCQCFRTPQRILPPVESSSAQTRAGYLSVYESNVGIQTVPLTPDCRIQYIPPNTIIWIDVPTEWLEAGTVLGKSHSAGRGDMNTTILWADAELIDVHLSYDLIVISIRDSTGHIRRVRGEGYIGFEFDGAWDEVGIVAARLSEHDDFARTIWESIRAKYAGSPPATGSPARNSAATWQTLEIEFSDGAVMRCAAAYFREE